METDLQVHNLVILNKGRGCNWSLYTRSDKDLEREDACGMEIILEMHHEGDGIKHSTHIQLPRASGLVLSSPCPEFLKIILYLQIN